MTSSAESTGRLMIIRLRCRTVGHGEKKEPPPDGLRTGSKFLAELDTIFRLLCVCCELRVFIEGGAPSGPFFFGINAEIMLLWGEKLSATTHVMLNMTYHFSSWQRLARGFRARSSFFGVSNGEDDWSGGRGIEGVENIRPSEELLVFSSGRVTLAAIVRETRC